MNKLLAFVASTAIAFTAVPAQSPSAPARPAELESYDTLGVPFKEGGRYFWFENSSVQSQGVLHVQQGAAGRPRVLLDPNTLALDGTVALSKTAASHDGRLLAYGIARSGSHWNEIRVRDVDSGRDRADTLRGMKFSGISWTRDSRGFFYSRYDRPADGNNLHTASRFHKVYYHRVGTKQASDELVYDRADQPAWRFNVKVSDDGQYAIIHVSEETETRNRIYYKDLASPGKPVINAPVVRLIDRLDASYVFVGNDGTDFLLRTNRNAPHGRLIAVDINNPREDRWSTVIPETKDLLQSTAFAGDRLVVGYVQDARTSIRLYRPDGTLRGAARPGNARGSRGSEVGGGTISGVARNRNYRFERELNLPGPGVATFNGSPDDREMLYSFTSDGAPTTVFRYDTRTGVSRVFRTVNR